MRGGDLHHYSERVQYPTMNCLVFGWWKWWADFELHAAKAVGKSRVCPIHFASLDKMRADKILGEAQLYCI